MIKNIFSRITNSTDLLIGVILGSLFTLFIGLFITPLLVAEIVWGIAFVFIMFLLFARH